MPNKPTHQNIADSHETTLARVKYAAKLGVNVYDSAALTAHLSTDGRIDKGAKLSETALELLEGAETIEDLIDVNGKLTNLADLKIVSLRIDNVKRATAVLKEQQKLISRAEVEERDLAIGNAMKLALLRLGQELPPVLEGLTVNEISVEVKKQHLAILHQLADQQSEIWTE